MFCVLLRTLLIVSIDILEVDFSIEVVPAVLVGFRVEIGFTSSDLSVGLVPSHHTVEVVVFVSEFSASLPELLLVFETGDVH